jgi:N utilization substance protein B
MQALYACLQSPDTEIQVQVRNLHKSIENTDTLLLYNLYLLVRVAAYAHEDKQIQDSKILRENKKLNISSRIYDNEVIQSVLESPLYIKYVEKSKPHLLCDDDLIRKVYLNMCADDKYIAYNNLTAPTEKDHTEALLHVYNTQLYNNEDVSTLTEEHFPTWVDEHTFIMRRMEEVLESKSYTLDEKEFKEADDFAIRLFNITRDNDNAFNELIIPKLKGWDAERIAQIDMIVMKMCLSELLYFPMIPVKVSINEYIDISKLYSTPKSKDFVNGVIDKIKNELLANNEIRKQGRGLVND